SACPGVEVRDLDQRAGPCVDEIEPAAPQLAGKRLRVGLNPEDRGPSLSRRLERLTRRLDAGDDGAQLGELCGRVAGPALQVEDALLGQVGEGVPDRERKAALAGERGGTLTVDLVPRAAVVVGRFHQAETRISRSMVMPGA